MDLAEGKLCDTCTAALNGETKIEEWKDYFGEIGNFPFDRYHHQSYRDFAASKESGCFICTLLWMKLPPPPQTEDGDSGQYIALDEFRVYFQGLSSTMRFHVVCPWGADIELNMHMKEKRDFPSRYAYHRPASPPPPPWTELDANIESSQSLQKIQDWISSCDKDHEHCRMNSSEAGTYFPTRAIDVHEAEVGIVHLRNRDEIEAQHDAEGKETSQRQATYPAYWTLSHRWGDPERIPRLLQITEHRFRGGIPLDDLSPTFRDAALLVRRLGYRYIWIDSLCIFQDSLSEWQQEAKAMVNVYRHSLCNISAIAPSSDPANTGLFRTRRLDPRLLFPFKVDKKLLERSGKVVDGPWIVWNDSFWTDEVETAPLSTRGWVVQERFLAPRIIHFTENQIYWECLESMYCEADPTGELLILGKQDGGGRKMATTVYKTAKLELAKARARLVGTRDQYSNEYWNHAQWGSIVSIYTNCALTKESDRLIAMSGIAKTFQEVNGDTYLAGLWKRMVYIDLAWTTNASGGAQVLRCKSYAPTWSWASVAGGHTVLHILKGKYGHLPTPLIKLVDARIVAEPPEGDSMGLLRSAELDIECMLYYYRWLKKSSKLAVYTDEARTQCFFEKEIQTESLRLDTTDLARKFAEVEEAGGLCVAIHGSYGGYGGGTNVYIMLEHGLNGKFKRIGLFHGGEIGKWIDGWSGQGTRITLV
ncbi:heterokaryon incompatibility protein-domain-containing protein [Thelonectria olida]|uniref:Heterokaryon incompatibility protein-domain-containing protein n=1 Tax=Thelonectria olida TaxID=1576542 RepID=A0A9P9AHH6_9HYPO|nr:heterokaryon incompatibility protein-domain-containing protein [Thelonectria olida]